MKKYTFTKGRLLGLICGAVLPAIAIGIGISMLNNDVMLDYGFVIVYFLMPLLAIGLLGLCVFRNRKTWIKLVISVIILVIFSVLFFYSALIAGWMQVKSYEGSEAVQQYSSVQSESKIMPDLTQVGETTNVEHYQVYSFFFIFSSETDYLICQYSQEEYETQKNRLNSVYTFQTETIKDTNSSCEPTAEIDGYQFKMLSIEQFEYGYPKNVYLIGYSDAAREIVYLEFYDIDLDFIRSLKEFIIDECGWKYIR